MTDPFADPPPLLEGGGVTVLPAPAPPRPIYFGSTRVYRPSEWAYGETREPDEVNGRFRIKCPDGRARLYSRCTTWIDSLDDKTALTKWRQRVILAGLRVDYTLWPRVRTLVPDPDGNRAELNEIADLAFAAGDGYTKAQRGTDLHALTARWDTLARIPPLPDADAAILAAYARCMETHRLEPVLVERRVVVDDLGVTGTFDRVVRWDGGLHILDIKTGSIAFSPGKTAQQLAVYAMGQLYADDGSLTGLRKSLPPVNPDVGLVLHLPQDMVTGGSATLLTVDLAKGRQGIELSREVRAWRNWSKDVLRPV